MLLKSLGARGVVYLGKAVLGNSSQGSHQPLCTAEPYQKNKTTPHLPPPPQNKTHRVSSQWKHEGAR